jgi:NIMA (never in mitosis gene a)-related kinase 1/4/5
MEKSAYHGKYQEQEEIGRGSFGVAYLVMDRRTKQFFVSKKFSTEGKSEKEVESAYNEIAILKDLDFPFIVKFIESFHEGREIIIIMEYCEEGDLEFHIKHRASQAKFFEEEVIVHWFIQLALGLNYLHSKHILHRDIKTSNIFLTTSGFVKIGDFGISKELKQTGELANTVIGTPYYMSPEILSDQSYGAKSDIWALGCVLYELCNLKHAFDVKNGSMFALFKNICEGKFEDING